MSLPVPIVSWEQVRRHRMERSGLVEGYATAEEVAGALFGIQAQIHPAAGLAIWNRMRGAYSFARYERELQKKRTLIKLWGQRGTLHAFCSAEWPLIYSVFAENKSWWHRNAEASAQLDDYDRLVETVAVLLRQQKIMGRSHLRASGLPFTEEHLSGWGGIFADLVKRGYACHAGKEEGEGIFAHREHWLPRLAWEPPDREEANLEVARRYFRSFGPSTPQDFTYWRGARGGSGHRRFGELLARGELAEVSVEGAPMWLPASELERLCQPVTGRRWPVKLLYRFDPFLLAHREKRWVVDDAYYTQVWRPAGHIEGIVLERGRGVATWRYDRVAGGLAISVTPFARLSPVARHGIERQAARVAAFFALPLQDLRMA
jgi:hypothetical protein